MLFSLLTIQFFALITPGPDFAFVASTALKGGKKDILYACIGITLGVFFWAFLSMTGLNILFTQYPMMQTLLSSLGAIYLYYLAWLIYQDARNPFVLTGNNGNTLLKGLMTNLSNPKAIIYFASIFSSFAAVSGQHSMLYSLMIISIITLETFIWFFCVGKIFFLPRSRQVYMRRKMHIDFISSAAFFLFATLILVRLFL